MVNCGTTKGLELAAFESDIVVQRAFCVVCFTLAAVGWGVWEVVV